MGLGLNAAQPCSAQAQGQQVQVMKEGWQLICYCNNISGSPMLSREEGTDVTKVGNAAPGPSCLHNSAHPHNPFVARRPKPPKFNPTHRKHQTSSCHLEFCCGHLHAWSTKPPDPTPHRATIVLSWAPQQPAAPSNHAALLGGLTRIIFAAASCSLHALLHELSRHAGSWVACGISQGTIPHI